MAETDDPSGNTEMFQAFVKKAATSDPEVAGQRSPIGIIIGVVAAVIIVIAVIALVALR